MWIGIKKWNIDLVQTVDSQHIVGLFPKNPKQFPGFSKTNTTTAPPQQPLTACIRPNGTPPRDSVCACGPLNLNITKSNMVRKPNKQNTNSKPTQNPTPTTTNHTDQIHNILVAHTKTNTTTAPPQQQLTACIQPNGTPPAIQCVHVDRSFSISPNQTWSESQTSKTPIQNQHKRQPISIWRERLSISVILTNHLRCVF
jgi:hypothetical protein